MGSFGRAALLGIGSGIALSLYLAVSTGWPTHLAIAAGGLVGLVLLVVAASLGEDPAAGDAAWRAAAADLYEAHEGDGGIDGER